MKTIEEAGKKEVGSSNTDARKYRYVISTNEVHKNFINIGKFDEDICKIATEERQFKTK